jgi:hypothetical protein
MKEARRMRELDRIMRGRKRAGQGYIGGTEVKGKLYL